MELQVVNAGKLELADNAFAIEFNEGLVHQVVTSYMATGRAGTKAQKNRSDVSGGGAKPWRQKGTGRARAGTSRSPIWRSGGVTFAARPRDYSQKINKKMYRKAMASIVSELIRQERLILVNDITIAEPKTKQVVSLIDGLKLEARSVLLVTAAQDDNLILAARNIPYVDAYSVNQLDPVALIGFDKVVMTVDSVKLLEEKLA
ncbi:MAG: 50S ribosomal protein L4 [Coxiellaceae bacterium]|nr:50S ribosomal protein L4 [Coxiellaceae bacterium]